MPLFLSPIGNSQTFDANGDPLNAGQIETYLAGSSTPAATYTDDTGGTPQSNPIILNSLGYPTLGPVWLTGGQSYKFIIKGADGVTLRTIDNISGVNDASVSQSEWVVSGFVPTYIDATSFSVPGDQTQMLQIGRRVRTTNTSGLVTSTISNSVFAAGITTVTLTNDSTTLDAGLTAVEYALLAASPLSVPNLPGSKITGLITASGLTMSTARMLGRTTASTGAIEELTAAQATAFVQGSGLLPGLGNKLINGKFQINQRAYVSGAATSGANQYTLDRWRVVTSGQNLTFSASGNGNQITAPAGGVEQVVEALNIEGGTYVLNWTGTATATVNGVARTKGENFTLTANSTATVRFSSGTVSLAQLELGTTPTPFQHRQISDELALCQRYYVAMTGLLKTQYAASTLTTNIASVEFPVTMRASPTIAFANVGYTNGSGLSAGTTTPSAARLAATISSGGNMLVTFDLLATAEL